MPLPRFFIVAMLALPGCAAPLRTVVLRVLDESGAPLPGAHVRAIALDASPVPLPVNAATLEQAAYAREAATASDSRGLVRLTVHNKSPHLVEVFAPPLGPRESEARGAWILDADGRTLRAGGVETTILLERVATP